MNFKCTVKFNILLFIALLLAKTVLGEGCDSNGPKCINCNDYQRCNAGFPEQKIISCKNGGNCANTQLKQCQKKLNCYALNECTQAGIFPDITVDSNYYVCLNDGSSGFLKYPFSCPEGNFFDKSALTCLPREATSPTTTTMNPTSPTTTMNPTSPTTTMNPTSPTTTTMNPTSTTTTMNPTSPTTTTTITMNPTSATTTMNPTSPTTTMKPISSSTTSPTISTETPPFICSGPGIFPNPGNCKMYYRCSTSLKAFFYICPGSSYFNEYVLKCSLIITSACQEQILRNSTSSLPPVPPTTSSTITTPKPTISPTHSPTPPTTISTITTTPKLTTTSTATTTTPATITTAVTSTNTAAVTTTSNSPTPTPFLCPKTGTYPNPLDCKTYYRCSLSEKIFRYICPGNTYFNEFTKTCSSIITQRCKNLIQG